MKDIDQHEVIAANFTAADDARDSFVKKNFQASLLHVRLQVNRCTLYDDVMKLYSTKPNLVYQYPLRVSFVGEKALDFGGISHDFFLVSGNSHTRICLMGLLSLPLFLILMSTWMISLLLEEYCLMDIFVVDLFPVVLLFQFWPVFY